MEMKTAPMEWMKKSNSTNVLMVLSFTVSLMGVALEDAEYWMVSMIVRMVLMKSKQYHAFHTKSFIMLLMDVVFHVLGEEII